MDAHVNLNYAPRTYQEAFHGNDSRWKVLVWHRGSGKTTAALGHLVIEALDKQGIYEFISPTYKQSKRNAWGILKKIVDEMLAKGLAQANESELKLTLPNGSVIYLLGSDNPDSLRGLDYHGVVYDEYQNQPSNIHSEIVLPRLAITNGWAVWIGTPKGKNSFYELLEYSKSHAHESWFSSVLTVDDTHVIDEETLWEYSQMMSEDEIDQEFFCSFNAAIKGAIYGKQMQEFYDQKRMVRSIYDKLLPVYTFWDLGIADYTSILFVQLAGNEVRIIDTYQSSGEALDHYATVCNSKPYTYEAHYFPHDIAVRELGSGLARMEIAHRLFGEEKCKMANNVEIKDGINAVRTMFYKIWMDEEQTSGFRNAISQYQYGFDESLGRYKDKPKHDWTSHYADALRYLGVTYQDMVQHQGVSKKKTFTEEYSDHITGEIKYRRITM